jgi:hypothetical protein
MAIGPTKRRGARAGFVGGIDGDILERMTSPKYYSYFERFYQKPISAAELTLTTETLHEFANQAWIVSGTGASSSLASFATKGGLLLTTGSTDLDSTYIAPNTNANFAAIKTKWDTDSQLMFSAPIVTGSAVTCHIIAGWSLTQTKVLATDADKCCFYYNNTTTNANYGPAGVGTLAASANWQCIWSIGGSDYFIDTGIPVLASTLYRLHIVLDASRIPTFYINDAQVSGTNISSTVPTALTDLATLEPHFLIGTESGSAAKTMIVRNVLLSQTF